MSRHREKYIHHCSSASARATLGWTGQGCAFGIVSLVGAPKLGSFLLSYLRTNLQSSSSAIHGGILTSTGDLPHRALPGESESPAELAGKGQGEGKPGKLFVVT